MQKNNPESIPESDDAAVRHIMMIGAGAITGMLSRPDQVVIATALGLVVGILFAHIWNHILEA